MKLVKGPNINLQHSLSKDPIGDRCVHFSVKPEQYSRSRILSELWRDAQLVRPSFG